MKERSREGRRNEGDSVECRGNKLVTKETYYIRGRSVLFEEEMKM